MRTPKKREFDKIPSLIKMKIRARRHNVQYKRVDKEMLNFLENHFEGNNVIELKSWWIDQNKMEETWSQEKWKGKQKWLETYEEKFDKKEYLQPK